MFVAHLPAGYLAGKAAFRHCSDPRPLWAAMLGSIFPDFDLAWFFLVDQGTVNHHYYWTHIPFYWLVLLVTLAALAGRRNREHVWMIMGFGIGIFTHMVLDGVAGFIFWLKPFSDLAVNAIGVKARFGWWPLNYIFHLSFLMEVAITMTAAGVWTADRARSKIRG